MLSELITSGLIHVTKPIPGFRTFLHSSFPHWHIPVSSWGGDGGGMHVLFHMCFVPSRGRFNIVLVSDLCKNLQLESAGRILAIN